jgi:hypothetical protein
MPRPPKPGEKTSVDMDQLHELFMSGMPLPEIAEILHISDTRIYQLIREAREIHPEKWPKRNATVGRKKDAAEPEPPPKAPLIATYTHPPLSTDPANGPVVKRQMTDVEREHYGTAIKMPTDSNGKDIKHPMHWKNYRNPLPNILD